jgi:hypothetical protein
VKRHKCPWTSFKTYKSKKTFIIFKKEKTQKSIQSSNPTICIISFQNQISFNIELTIQPKTSLKKKKTKQNKACFTRMNAYAI